MTFPTNTHQANSHATARNSVDQRTFNGTVTRKESADVIELDLRPFGALQGAALDFFLEMAPEQDSFGKSFVLKTDASVALSDSARAAIAKLQEKRIAVTVLAQR